MTLTSQSPQGSVQADGILAPLWGVPTFAVLPCERSAWKTAGFLGYLFCWDLLLPGRWDGKQSSVWCGDWCWKKPSSYFLLQTLLISGFPFSQRDPCSVPLSPFLWIIGTCFCAPKPHLLGFVCFPYNEAGFQELQGTGCKVWELYLGSDGQDTSSRISFVFALLLKLRASFVLLKVTSRKSSVGLCVAKHWFHSCVSYPSTAVMERSCNKCFSISAQQCILLWTSWNL